MGEHMLPAFELDDTMVRAPLGLKLSYFNHFMELHGGREAFKGLTTAQVCFQFVVPFTQTSRMSLVDHVHLNSEDAVYVEPANWYVSHAWAYLFLETLDSLESFFQRLNIANPVVWFCVFNNNQHEANSYEFEWWQSTFKDSLSAIGNVVMILHPWKNPITLKRSWCVFEVYVSICVGAKFEVAMAAKQEENLFEEILNEIEEFLAVLGAVNSKEALATVPADKVSIDNVIENEVGFLELDRMIFDKFKQWMVNSIQSRIDSASTPLEMAKYNFAMAEFLAIQREVQQAIPYSEKALSIYSHELQDDSLETLQSKAQLAVLHAYDDCPRSQWEPMLLDAITELTSVAGSDHIATLSALHHLARIYIDQGDPEVGLNILLEVQELVAKRCGHDHKFAHILTNEINEESLGRINSLNDKMNPEECYIKLSKSLGTNHPFTLSALENMANFYRESDEPDKAIQLQEQVYQKTLRNFGLENEATLHSLLALGIAYMRGELFNKAVEKLQLTIDISEKISRKNSIIVVQAYAFLGFTYWKGNNLELAFISFYNSLERWETQGNKKFRDEALSAMLECHESLNIQSDLHEIDQMIKWLQDANLWNESRAEISCTLCEIPELYGIVYNCPRCALKIHQICAACCEILPQCVHCEAQVVASIPPPRRLLQLKISLLEQRGHIEQAIEVKSLLQSYCHEFSIPIEHSNDRSLIVHEEYASSTHSTKQVSIWSLPKWLCPCFLHSTSESI